MDINLDDLEKNTVKQLRDFAGENEINLRGKYLKADIIEIIREYLEGLENVVTDEPVSALETLPLELFREVVLRLSVSEMVDVCSTNKRISNLCEPRLWREKYNNFYGPQRLKPKKSWMENIVNMNVVGVGDDRYNQLGFSKIIGGVDPKSQFAIDVGWTRKPNKVIFPKPVKITQVSAYERHTLFLDENRKVWGVGGWTIELPDSINNPNPSTPLKIPNLSNIKQVVAGRGCSLYVDYDGRVWANGINEMDKLGMEDELIKHPTQIPGLSDIVQVDTAGEHTVCLDSSGRVWGIGSNTHGELGMEIGMEVDKLARVSTPKPIPWNRLPVKIVAVSAGVNYTVFLDINGKVWVAGSDVVDFIEDDIRGQLGLGKTSIFVGTPTQVPGLSNIKQISTGRHHTLCLDGDGVVWGFGINRQGQLGFGEGNGNTVYNKPKVIKSKGNKPLPKMIQVSAGSTHSVFIDTKHQLWGMGSNVAGQLTKLPRIQRGPPTYRLERMSPWKAVEVSAGDRYTMWIGMER